MNPQALEYNTEREPLIIPEYGRIVQKMINHALSIEDDEQRNKIAKAIIGVMGNMQPHLRDVPDFQHKLWDQLFIISKFQLKVETPYPILSEEELKARPEKLNYPQNFPKYRFYGNNITKMIAVAIKWKEGELKKALIYSIANHMKKSFLSWNKDTVEDAVIYKHLFELSKGEIDLRQSNNRLKQSSSLLKSRRRDSYASNSNNKHSRSHNYSSDKRKKQKFSYNKNQK